MKGGAQAVALTAQHGAEWHVVVIFVLGHLNVALFDIERVLLEEELGQFTDLLRHLDSHDLAAALDLSN